MRISVYTKYTYAHSVDYGDGDPTLLANNRPDL
jgi:hypothetical protein